MAEICSLGLKLASLAKLDFFAKNILAKKIIAFCRKHFESSMNV